MDLDFLSWPLKPEDLKKYSSLYTLASWWFPVHQMGSKHEELALTELPLMVRLLSWEKKGCSLFGAPMDERKLALQKALNEVGKRVGENDFPGVLALKKQTVTAKQLSDTLTDADELIVGLVALNQKEQVWQGMALLEDTFEHEVCYYACSNQTDVQTYAAHFQSYMAPWIRTPNRQPILLLFLFLFLLLLLVVLVLVLVLVLLLVLLVLLVLVLVLVLVVLLLLFFV